LNSGQRAAKINFTHSPPPFSPVAEVIIGQPKGRAVGLPKNMFSSNRRYKNVYKKEPAYKSIAAVERWYFNLPRKKKKAARARYQELVKASKERSAFLMKCFY